MHVHGYLEGCVFKGGSGVPAMQEGLPSHHRDPREQHSLPGELRPALLPETVLSHRETGLLGGREGPTARPAVPGSTRALPASLPHPRRPHYHFWHPDSGTHTSLPIAQKRTPRPRKRRVEGEWGKHGSHAGGLPDTPAPSQLPLPQDCPPSVPSRAPLFLKPAGCGGGLPEVGGVARGFLSGLREKALKEGRRKEQPAATKGFKGLGPLPSGLKPGAAQRGLGSRPRPRPAAKAIHPRPPSRERWAAG